MSSFKLPLWSMLLLSLISFFVVAYTLFSSLFRRAPMGTIITTIIVWAAFMLLVLSIFHLRKSITSSPDSKLRLVKKFYHERWGQLWLIFPPGIATFSKLRPLLREVYGWDIGKLPKNDSELAKEECISSKNNSATIFFREDAIELQCREKLPSVEKVLAEYVENPSIPTITLLTKEITNPGLRRLGLALRDYMLSNNIQKAKLFRLESLDEWFWNDVAANELAEKLVEYIANSRSIEIELETEKVCLEFRNLEFENSGKKLMLQLTAPQGAIKELVP